MRKTTLLLVIFTVLAIVFSFGTTFAHGGCDGASPDHPNHKHTASGSCKDTDDHNIRCGTEGQPVPDASDTSVHANQDNESADGNNDGGVEAEFCNDGNAGNFNGRLLVDVNPQEQGVRVILDSDRDQPFDAGWIIVQGSAQSGNDNGVYCSRDPGEGSEVEGDGYRQSWDDPGPNSGADCVPNPPI